jgi:hypothetical protein
MAPLMGAAGWHICFDVLDHALSGTPIGRIVGPEAMKFGGWQRLKRCLREAAVASRLRFRSLRDRVAHALAPNVIDSNSRSSRHEPGPAFPLM